MRRMYAALILAVLVPACGDENPPPKTPETTAVSATPPATVAPPPATTEATPPPPPPKPTLAELIQKNNDTFVQGMMARDAKKMASVYSENAVIKMAGMPDMTGREAVAQMHQKMFDAWSNSKGSASRIWMKGDVVITEWQMVGTHSGDFMGVKATEKPVGWQGISVTWYGEDGLRKEEHTYADMMTPMAQIGKAPKGMKARAVPALAQKPEIFMSKGDDTENKNMETAKVAFGAFEKKDANAFVGTMADNVEWDDMTQPVASKGKAESKKFFEMMTKAFPDTKAEIKNIWAFGDYVIVEEVMTGTHKGDFMGIKATKKPVNMHGIDVIQVKDGKAVHGWSYMNGAEMAMQLGLMPDPTKPAPAPAAPKGGSAPAPAPKGGTAPAPKK